MQGGELFQDLFGQNLPLHSEDLPEFHHRPFERAKFLFDAPRRFLAEFLLICRLRLLSQKQILNLVPEVTPG